MIDLREREVITTNNNADEMIFSKGADSEIKRKTAEYNGTEYKPQTDHTLRDLKRELEYSYRKDPILFNSINTYTQVSEHAGHSFIGPDKEVKYLNEFFENIGDVGGGVDKDNLFDSFTRYCFIYGEWYAQKIKSNKGTIVDLLVLDPKNMDYARSTNGDIVIDELGRPVGYVEYTRDGYNSQITAKFGKSLPPKGISLTNVIRYFPREDIAHIKLYTFGDRFYGLGLIEPGYENSKYKLNMENSFANLSMKHANPKMVAKVGDQTHEPTPNVLASALDGLTKVTQYSEFSLPYWVNIEYLQAKQPDQAKSILDYFISQEIASTGVPSAFASASGEATNRSTLVSQGYMMKIRLNGMLKRMVSTFNSELTRPILKSAGFSKPTAKLVWGDVVIEALESKAERLINYAKVGLIPITPEIVKYIQEVENLPKSNSIGDVNVRKPNVDTSKEI